MDPDPPTQPHLGNGNLSAEAARSADAPGAPESPPTQLETAPAARVTPMQIALIVLGTIAFLYFARPVLLPIILACVAAMTLKPLIRWLDDCHIRPAFSAALVLGLLVAGISIGFFQLGRPALVWMNE